MFEGAKGGGMTDRGLDDPVPDVVEQSQEAVPHSDEDDEAGDDVELMEEVPLEADPADAAEQAREIELGEEDYR
jgi:hypothetical protein